MYPTAIIAGTNKAGTTSLFRYLSDHPDVCPSRIKEVRHFTRHADPFDSGALRAYAEQFAGCGAENIRLEASPDYLSGGQAVATAIRQLLPDVRLIFVLREPVSRLISGYRRRKSRADKKLDGLSLQQYLDALSGGDPTHAGDLLSVRYAHLVSAYLDTFPAAQIAVRFFDDLEADSRTFVTDLCAFLEIDPAFFAEYEFGIENQTRNIRYKSLHKLVHRLNMGFEPLLNRFPDVRSALRSAYNRVNEAPGMGAAADAPALNAISQAVSPDLRALRELLEKADPGRRFPPWLHGH